MHWKRCAALAALLSLSVISSGCYLAHVARGQTRLLWSRIPVADLMREPATAPELRANLERVAEVRRYAKGLGLAVGDRYTDYAPWPGDSVVTTVVATRQGSVELVTTWFPIVGRVPYRGYFDGERAAAEAVRLNRQDLDVCVVKVRAYSTLGWFDDPLTGPLLREDEATLVETLFHELLHATVFVPGEADFNEGVAAFFGQEARIRFYADRDGAESGERERRAVAESRRLRAEILALRHAVQALYASAASGPERQARRAALESGARRRIAALAQGGRQSRPTRSEPQASEGGPLRPAGGRQSRPTRSPQGREAAAQQGEAERSVGPREEWQASEGGPLHEVAGYDTGALGQLPLNDACLALSGTYHADTRRLAGVLAALGGDLAAFVARVKSAAEADDPRTALLGGARAR